LTHPRRVANVAPGQNVKLVVVRDRATVPLSVTVGEMPGEQAAVASSDSATEGFGLQVEPLNPALAERLNLPVGHGLVVTDVASGGPAELAGLRRGDVILEVNRQPVTDAAALAKTLSALKPGESTLVYLHRPGGGGRNQYLVLERGQRP